ncbi:hypothetical protein SCARR_04070 [Pontiella sulfatireligans]|uniref:Uncharacterized protein n=1 Tax=Pontiella sulfatireligans TaxID=2750658 RepID=A0A6C2UNX2_9BACT|nr:hypothetical protein SCARR_04070 [Pontiella sulfatireligans]
MILWQNNLVQLETPGRDGSPSRSRARLVFVWIARRSSPASHLPPPTFHNPLEVR